jgi:hypothetical protein
MSRDFLCFTMTVGMGGFFGVLAGTAHPLFAVGAFAALMMTSLAAVMVHDDRERWRRMREGK